ncbi:MAG: phospholipase D-like domain-containing protein [Bacteroidetes bacterium]|nr:phospholipase D-like domain-containing protein [Bacteroidota bacterium]
MKKIIYSIVLLLIVHCIVNIEFCKAQNATVISNLTYDSIVQTGVTVYWTTDSPADTRIRWMAPDSNYQPLIFTDSIYISAMVTNHVLPIGNLQPAKIYKYQVMSQNAGGTTVDSGYFVTQSASTGMVEVYFNHTVDTTVSAGEKANGSQNFETLLDDQINKATHSIDITLWEFHGVASVTEALINAKSRGVKIRFIYNHMPDTSQVDSLIAHGIPVLKRNYLTNFSMHDKFWIFDYRDTTSHNNKYLWTGSTNVSHAMFHQDRNNIILIQDESLCAVYTREFEEMWGSHTDLPDPTRAKFGPEKVNNTPRIVNVAGTRMEVYFAPTDSISDTICSIIGSKIMRSIFFCMYKFSLPPVEEALHMIYNGKHLSGVFDSSNSVLHNSAFPRMKGKPVAGTWDPPAHVFIDTIPGLLHHKYFLVDADTSGGNKIIATGSYNWETPAETGNDENLLVIYDARVNNLYFQEFLARYRESGGALTGSGIGDGGVEVPKGFSLYQNYPNPFNPVTNIKFYVAKSSDVKIVVYDMMGRKVQTLVKETLKPGTYESSFDGSSLTGGIYLYKISAGDYSETKRMMLEK